jgi:hypothetical protein
MPQVRRRGGFVLLALLGSWANQTALPPGRSPNGGLTMYRSEKTGAGRGAERCGVRVARHRFLTHGSLPRTGVSVGNAPSWAEPRRSSRQR